MEIKVKPEEMRTFPAAAKKLGISKMTLYRWKDLGKIEWVEVGGILFLTPDEVERIRKEKAADDGSAA